VLRLGLLRCDEVSDQRLKRFGGYQRLFKDLLQTTSREICLTDYDVAANVLPSSSEEQDGWIISGAVSAAYDRDPWIDALLNIIRDLHITKARMIGICFGHQAIAQALGGQVHHSGFWGIGVRRAKVINPSVAMEPVRRGFGIAYCHQDQVTSLPPEARLTSSTAHCRVASFAIQDHIVGIQGHPEFHADFARDLYSSRLADVGHKAVAEAISTLEKDTDQAAVAEWMLRTLADKPLPS